MLLTKLIDALKLGKAKSPHLTTLIPGIFNE